MQHEELQKFAAEIDEFRENLGAMVISLVNDGFTDAQARIIITSLFAGKITPRPTDPHPHDE